MSDRFHIEHITLDCRNARELAAFWSAATGLAVVDDWDGFVRLEPGQGGIRFAFQEVPEEKIAKNRMHIDVNTDDMAATVDRLVGLGATVVERHSGEHVTWTVMQDPEGNEFCVN